MSEHVYERRDTCVACGTHAIGMGPRNPANGRFHCYDCTVDPMASMGKSQENDPPPYTKVGRGYKPHPPLWRGAGLL